MTGWLSIFGALDRYEAGEEIVQDLFPGHDVMVKLEVDRKRGYEPKNIISDYKPAALPVVQLRPAGQTAMTYVVQAARDRAATGRSILGTVAGVALGVGLLTMRLGGVPVPITAPPAAPAPIAIPGGGHPGGGGHRLLIPVDANGSCYIDASVNGSKFSHMLLDSGAAGYHLVFGRNHAARLGFDPDTLSYDDTYGSANGTGHEAIVTLREFRIGSFVLHDVPAAITEKALFAPLVAVGILHRLGLRLIDGHCEIRLP